MDLGHTDKQDGFCSQSALIVYDMNRAYCNLALGYLASSHTLSHQTCSNFIDLGIFGSQSQLLQTLNREQVICNDYVQHTHCKAACLAVGSRIINSLMTRLLVELSWYTLACHPLPCLVLRSMTSYCKN